MNKWIANVFGLVLVGSGLQVPSIKGQFPGALPSVLLLLQFAFAAGNLGNFGDFGHLPRASVFYTALCWLEPCRNWHRASWKNSRSLKNSRRDLAAAVGCTYTFLQHTYSTPKCTEGSISPSLGKTAWSKRRAWSPEISNGGATMTTDRQGSNQRQLWNGWYTFFHRLYVSLIIICLPVCRTYIIWIEFFRGNLYDLIRIMLCLLG